MRPALLIHQSKFDSGFDIGSAVMDSTEDDATPGMNKELSRRMTGEAMERTSNAKLSPRNKREKMMHS